MDKAQEIVKFWSNDVGTGGWYTESVELDEMVRQRFSVDWENAKAGKYDSWACCPDKSLALLILLDQFPRNMFRNDPLAFSTDKKAREVASQAIDHGYDLRTDEPERQFYYMPLMHSESLSHQERCVRLMKNRMPDLGQGNLLHAKVHREIIRRFGRFPYRNEALGRKSTLAEVQFAQNGGYRHLTEEMEAAA